MSRITWILGNWKQNHRVEAAEACAKGVAAGLQEALDEAKAKIDAELAKAV